MSKAGFDPSSSQRRGEQTQTHTSRMPRRSRTIWVLRVKHVAANSILRRMAPGVLAKNAIRVAIDLNGRLRATRRRALQGTDPRGTLAFRRRHQPRQAQSCRSTSGTLRKVELDLRLPRQDEDSKRGELRFHETVDTEEERKSQINSICDFLFER